jgi:hypothetical protein
MFVSGTPELLAPFARGRPVDPTPGPVTTLEGVGHTSGGRAPLVIAATIPVGILVALDVDRTTGRSADQSADRSAPSPNPLTAG